jgi:hypothetical protein
MAQRVAIRRPALIEQCYLCHQTNSFSSFRATGTGGQR